MDVALVIGDTMRVVRGDERDLVTTPVAAATLGISPRTLQRYVQHRALVPAVVLPSGQYRWDLATLARDIATLSASRASAPGGAG